MHRGGCSGRPYKQIKAMQAIQLQSTLSVYVVIANEEEKVKECHVIQDHAEAFQKWQELINVYGGGNVCFASRSMHMSIQPSGN